MGTRSSPLPLLSNVIFLNYNTLKTIEVNNYIN